MELVVSVNNSERAKNHHLLTFQRKINLFYENLNLHVLHFRLKWITTGSPIIKWGKSTGPSMMDKLLPENFPKIDSLPLKNV